MLAPLLIIAALLSGASASSAARCAGPDATLTCVKRHFGELYSAQYERFWIIVREAARVAHQGAARGRGCEAQGEVAEFLTLAAVPNRNAEFQEFLADHVEHLCVEAPACFRTAAGDLDAPSRKALARMLAAPLFVDRGVLDGASCLARP